MKLTNEERDILAGKQGEVMAKVLRSFVMYGEVFGAKRPFTADPRPYDGTLALKNCNSTKE
ncbi:MAG: aconitase X [Candidatus Entotheonellia bacterium]